MIWDERQPFRGTTHDSPILAQLKSANTLATFNGVTRPHLLYISGGSSREKALYRTQAAFTLPLSLTQCNRYRTARSTLLHIVWILPHLY